jgi:Na+/melibiose symporter-like transporter
VADTRSTQLTRAQWIAFIAPAAPIGALALPPLVFLPNYFNTVLGIDLAAVSAIFLAARAIDIVVDPTIGAAIDRTRTSFGARRAWLAGALVPLCALVWLTFIGFGPGASAVAVGVAVLALYSVYSASVIAHLGWAGDLRPDYHGRTKILAIYQAATAAGSTVVLLLPAIAGVLHLGPPGTGVHLMGWALIVALPLTLLPALAFTPEPAPRHEHKTTFGEALAAIAQNRALAIVLIADLAIGVAQGVSGSLFVFFAQAKLGFTHESEALLLVYFVAALAGVPVWAYVARKGAKHTTVAFACVYAAVTTLVIPFLPPKQTVLAAAALFFAGLANGAHIFLLRAMLADVVDEDEVKLGRRRSGLMFGLLLTTSKAGQALGPLTFAVLALYGFDGKLGQSRLGAAILSAGRSAPEALARTARALTLRPASARAPGTALDARRGARQRRAAKAHLTFR